MNVAYYFVTENLDKKQRDAVDESLTAPPSKRDRLRIVAGLGGDVRRA